MSSVTKTNSEKNYPKIDQAASFYVLPIHSIIKCRSGLLRVPINEITTRTLRLCFEQTLIYKRFGAAPFCVAVSGSTFFLPPPPSVPATAAFHTIRET
jgi:hypothetical protein